MGSADDPASPNDSYIRIRTLKTSLAGGLGGPRTADDGIETKLSLAKRAWRANLADDGLWTTLAKTGRRTTLPRAALCHSQKKLGGGDGGRRTLALAQRAWGDHGFGQNSLAGDLSGDGPGGALWHDPAGDTGTDYAQKQLGGRAGTADDPGVDSARLWQKQFGGRPDRDGGQPPKKSLAGGTADGHPAKDSALAVAKRAGGDGGRP